MICRISARARSPWPPCARGKRSRLIAGLTGTAPPLSLSQAPSTARVTTDKTLSVTPLGSKEFCYGLPGAMEPVGPFDPLGFTKGADVLEVNRLRESELTHGRVAMLASAGFIVQEGFHPLFSEDGGPAIQQIPQLPAGFLVALAMSITALESLRISKGFAPPTEANLKDARAGGQSQSFQRLRADYVPGDMGFDPLGLKPTDPTALRLMQEKELSNGRLAMIAAAGFLAQEAVSGQTWGLWWDEAVPFSWSLENLDGHVL